ncbi:succinate-semialdehyde dehydrogenase / glutarate-semialdehyde dehydrogenase [Brevibacterium siliguriense]|uniref:Succinate-semialdehyde dehydrogenase / glutarate-semialdehyde dehydrogenase n=1 Tax=Brevibacterium siliguriense TaxID=1136497 RepID=A0A1H1NBC6_9MICO|nr:succinic semialdehyde dehydrogenase [Brevibacterium siliguriense]SDR96341.1 succinate-semialdehyde dehydrogenase / glutarate-semialdehyde dehydrogenase [Brevibacterium siliguriense]
MTTETTADTSETVAAGTASVHVTAALRDFLGTDPYADASGSGEVMRGVEPFTGKEVVRFARNTPADIEAAYSTARIAGSAWAAQSIQHRTKVLNRLHSALVRNEDLLLDIIQYETGKARIHAYDEILDTFNVLRHYGVMAARYLRPERRRGAIPVLTRTELTRTPLGVIGFITPWNYPLTLGATDLFAALTAGNAVVHKPDSTTTLTSVFMRRLAIAAGLPPEVWQLVPGPSSEVGPALMAGADGISFTGSTAAGRSIAAEAGQRLLPAALELGGKNPLIVAADADLDKAVEGAVRGSFSSAGQLCISIERIYVHDDLYEDFCARFAEAARACHLGAEFEYGPDMGTLAGPKQLETITNHVEQARSVGATVLAGGHPLPDLGPYFYAPTVLTDVPASAELHREETFGPIVSIYSVPSDAAAIAAANDSDYGLSASVYSRSHGREIARQVEAGMVNVNEVYPATWGSIDAPAGGVKASGLGHRHGPEGLYQFMYSHTIAEQRLHPIAPTGPLDQKTFAKAMTGALTAMRSLRMK